MAAGCWAVGGRGHSSAVSLQLGTFNGEKITRAVLTYSASEPLRLLGKESVGLFMKGLWKCQPSGRHKGKHRFKYVTCGTAALVVII